MSTDEELVVLVDELDRVTGSLGKLEAHRTGARHRAVSVFVFDAKGRLLLQRRAEGKYHSAGQWANTCCTHPRPGESALDAASRRLHEEMGVECELMAAGTFSYRCDVGGGLIEHEIDHVFVGTTNGEPRLNGAEVQECRWVSIADLKDEIRSEPTSFVPWLEPALRALATAQVK